jgi:predicted HNH restriction endonuclease
MSAYHNLCTACADRLGVCAKCTQNEEVVNRPEVDRSAEIEAKLKTFKERTRRTLVRKIEKGELEAVAVLDMIGDKKKKNADDDDSDDDDDVGSEGAADDDDEDGNDSAAGEGNEEEEEANKNSN